MPRETGVASNAAGWGNMATVLDAISPFPTQAPCISVEGADVAGGLSK